MLSQVLTLLIFTLAAATAAANTLSTEASTGHKSLLWSLGLGMSRYENTLADRKTQASFQGNILFNYSLNDSLKIKIQPKLNFKNGYVQNYSASAADSTSITFSEASTTFHSSNQIFLTLGAVNQQDQLSSFMMDELAFPAAVFKARSKPIGRALAITGMAAIPTSSTLSTQSKDSEKTPSLFAGGLSWEASDSELPAKAQAMYFKFSELPARVANDSSLIGNTISNTSGGDNSRFLYGYEGIDLSLQVELPFSKQFSGKLVAAGIENHQAPKGLNRAWTIKGQFNIYQHEDLWSPYLEFFRAEADATVAHYMDPAYQTNRIGYRGGLEYSYKSTFKLKFSGGLREVLLESASQSRDQFASIGLETPYAPF